VVTRWHDSDPDCPCALCELNRAECRPPAPLIAGAIGRGLADAAAAYKRSLEVYRPPTVQG
jgi:hypothetical protein